jgi:hypothetical protein
MKLSRFTAVILGLIFSLSMASGQEKAGTTLLKAFGSLVSGNREKCEASKETIAMPQNSLDTPSAGITPTGERLKPFGQPDYWQKRGVAPETPSIDDELAILPPLPDLRTPDQITSAERKRNFRNAKFAERQAQNVIAAEERKMAELAEVEKPPVDPSTALIQVESKRDGAQDCGRRERPATVNGGNLKPFNASSSYVEGCEVKFQWSNHQFVETQPEALEDELGLLPPLPDLRTPDQITRGEKVRNLRNLKFRGRQAEYEAKRRAAEEAAQATVDPF